MHSYYFLIIIIIFKNWLCNVRAYIVDTQVHYKLLVKSDYRQRLLFRGFAISFNQLHKDS